MTSEYTRSGTRRSGDDYQDLIALEVIIEMLEHPDRYKWISVEDDEFGFLDDVVALRSDGLYDIKQVKYSNYPENAKNEWTWKILLERKKGKDGKELTSLLKKWFESYLKISGEGKINIASLVTNRISSLDIKSIISPDGIINYHKIPDEIKKNIKKQLGDEEQIKIFFNNFHFLFDQHNIHIKEENIKRRLFSLNGTVEGWLNLKDEMRSWIRKKKSPPPDGKITIDIARQAAFWHELKSLPQNFTIPEDFVLSSLDFHKSILKDINDNINGCFVISANPGVGKSTYLSYLYNNLKDEKILVIRHHYFISFSDKTVGRFNFIKIVESLYNDIKMNYSSILGEYQNMNPDYEKFSSVLETCGRNSLLMNSKLVIIIDGLDHVWREKRSTIEIQKLMEHLLPPRDGIIIIIGTQPIDDDIIPNSIIREAPTKNWKILPHFSKKSLKEWLVHYKHNIIFEDEDDFSSKIKPMVDALYNKSNGHPLYLHYIITYFIDRRIPITSENIKGIDIKPNNDIEKYYEYLWSNISEYGRKILHLITACNYSWPKKYIVECLSQNSDDTSNIISGLKDINFLFLKNPYGFIPYHQSLLIFIANREDHIIYSKILKNIVLKWLKSDAPKYWSWSYLWLLEFELGNDEPIINGPNRSWVLNAIKKRYPSGRAIQILSSASYLALKKKNFPKYIELGLLNDYLRMAYDFRYEIIENLLFAQLHIEEDDDFSNNLYENLENLSDKELEIISYNVLKSGNNDIIHRCFKIINEKLTRYKDDDSRMNFFDIKHKIRHLTKIAAIDKEIDENTFFNFHNSNKESGLSNIILRTYLNSLRKVRNTKRIKKLLKMGFDKKEYSKIMNCLFFISLEEDVKLKEKELFYEKYNDPYSIIYCYINNIECNINNLNIPSSEIFQMKEYEIYDYREDITDYFYEIFYYFLANHFNSNSERNIEWLKSSNIEYWPNILLNLFNDISNELFEEISNNNKVKYSWIFQKIEDLAFPDWTKDRKSFEFGIAARKSIWKIADDIILLSNKKQIELNDIKEIINNDFYYSWNWINDYVQYDRKILTIPAVKYLLENGMEELSNTIETFSERADKYSTLANLAAFHGLKDYVNRTMNEASNNLISYGDHKDVLLFNVLDIIEDCHGAKINRSKEFLLHIAPIISKVDEFTDGDETNYLPKEYSEKLSKISPEFISNYYRWQCEKEEYFDAIHTFHQIIETINLNTSINRKIVETAIDDNSIKIMKKRVLDGDLEFSKILKEIYSSLKIRVKEEKNSENIYHQNYKKDNEQEKYPNPNEFPPEKLLDYINELYKINYYNISNGMKLWIENWMKNGKDENVLSQIEKIEEMGIDVGNYDILYDISRSNYGIKEAYKWLIKLYIASHGWNRYSSSDEKKKKYWNIIKIDYPNKWHQFLLETLDPTKNIPWYQLSVFTNVKRINKFLIEIGEITASEQLLKQIVKSTIELVSPIHIPLPSWMEKLEIDKNNLSLLFSRLIWPSSLVRERTCSCIAELLCDQDWSLIIKEKLLKWLKHQKLESIAAYGLLIPIKSYLKNSDIIIEDIDQYYNAIDRKSLLSRNIVDDVRNVKMLDDDLSTFHSGNPPEDFLPNSFFIEYMDRFLPPIYKINSEKIDKHIQGKMVLQWAYEWHIIIGDHNISLSQKPMNFRGNEYDDIIQGYDSYMSDIYRSAYLRALSWVLDNDFVSKDVIEYYVLQTCPINFTLWDLKPMDKPKFWPKISRKCKKKKTIYNKIINNVSSLLKTSHETEEKWEIGRASGRVYDNNSIYDLEIFGFLWDQKYQIMNNIKPIINKYKYQNLTYCENQNNFLDGNIINLSYYDPITSIIDYGLIPLSTELKSYSIPIWQYWRMYRGIWIPIPLISLNIKRNYEDKGILVIDENENILGKWYDWLDRFREKNPMNVSFSNGMILEINKDILAKYYDNEIYSIIWICEIIRYHRESKIEKYQVESKIFTIENKREDIFEG